MNKSDTKTFLLILNVKVQINKQTLNKYYTSITVMIVFIVKKISYK